jgi:hypothetical protein
VTDLLRDDMLAPLVARKARVYRHAGRGGYWPSDGLCATPDYADGHRIELPGLRRLYRATRHNPAGGIRKQIVEPVFGQIKQARGFRQFLLRGVEKVRAEWAIICTAHNLLKLARAA